MLSKLVAGAYAQTIMLGEGRGSIHVTLHAKVRSIGELQDTRRWRLEKISRDDEPRLDLLLKPVRSKERANISKFGVAPVGRKDRFVTVEFFEVSADCARSRKAEKSMYPFERRLREEQSQAERI